VVMVLRVGAADGRPSRLAPPPESWAGRANPLGALRPAGPCAAEESDEPAATGPAPACSPTDRLLPSRASHKPQVSLVVLWGDTAVDGARTTAGRRRAWTGPALVPLRGGRAPRTANAPSSRDQARGRPGRAGSGRLPHARASLLLSASALVAGLCAQRAHHERAPLLSCTNGCRRSPSPGQPPYSPTADRVCSLDFRAHKSCPTSAPISLPDRSGQLLGGGGGAGVELLSPVVDDALDKALLLEVLDGSARNRSVDCGRAEEGRSAAVGLPKSRQTRRTHPCAGR
jgi:hypothetical protein